MIDWTTPLPRPGPGPVARHSHHHHLSCRHHRQTPSLTPTATGYGRHLTCAHSQLNGSVKGRGKEGEARRGNGRGRREGMLSNDGWDCKGEEGEAEEGERTYSGEWEREGKGKRGTWKRKWREETRGNDK